MVLNETQTEDENYIIYKAGMKNSITISTNSASRGTDIKLSEESKQLGGLHVMYGYFAPNIRVECQALGRSGR